MDEDVNAPALNASEDSGEENDGDDECDEVDKVESETGATGVDGKVAGEKLFDKEGDKDLVATNKKYEPGSWVDDWDPSNRELRAKDDPAAADENADGNSDASGEDNKLRELVLFSSCRQGSWKGSSILSTIASLH